MMHLHLSGKDSTQPLFNLVAALTDHARLRFREIRYDKSTGVVVIPIKRFPLLKQRRVLGNVHEDEHPIESQIIIRYVESCEIEDSVAKPAISDVTIQFGLNVKEDRIIAASAEEDRGQICFMMEIKVSEIDIEILDKQNDIER
jgi:hypothetical protein